LNEGVVCNGGAGAGTCNISGTTYPGGLPAPNQNVQGVTGPETGLIVKFNAAVSQWQDQLGRNWNNAVRFALPDNMTTFRVMAVACVGFVLNHFAPMRLRLPVFALVSLAGIYWVMGANNAIQLVALGLLLIGLAHLPIRFGWRVGLILAFGSAYAAMRVSILHTPVSNAIWPILSNA
jgi:hypothetical protein